MTYGRPSPDIFQHQIDIGSVIIVLISMVLPVFELSSAARARSQPHLGQGPAGPDKLAQLVSIGLGNSCSEIDVVAYFYIGYLPTYTTKPNAVPFVITVVVRRVF